MRSEVRCGAMAKVNLCLFLGPLRPDARHELVTLFETVGLEDELVITALPDGRGDEVVCAGIGGPNLVTAALAALRAAGWEAPPVRVQIDKRIPVAAGMGGGSADAAAMLRSASELAPVAGETVAEIAARLGSDVPSQLDPGLSLGTGAGDVVRPVGAVHPHALLVLPQSFGLSTPDVYREADRIGLPRSATDLAALRADLEGALDAAGITAEPLPGRLVVNDLQPAALSLRPEIAEALDAALDQGADRAIVCGSGPTVIGIFWGDAASRRAQLASKRLRGSFPAATSTKPLVRGVPAPTPNQ
jgi:4-diphosphocytidyl-2-C-methyl-D-erythritol kinase